MSGPTKSSFAASMLAHLQRRRWLKPGDRLGIAVSGGADSVALLRAMLELRDDLGIVLSVVHLNHTLRGDESDADQAFVRDLARAHELQLHEASTDVALRAKDHSLSTEAAAREARYEFFWSLLRGDLTRRGHLDKIATAHTLDDQAETVLLRLIRGTGTRGLGGIRPQLVDSKEDATGQGSIIRPLLHARRREVEAYLTGLGQAWREDSSNRDLHHTRNRVRKLLIPLLESDFNPEIGARLADFAEIARGEEEFWAGELQRLNPGNSLQTDRLHGLPLALRRRLIRAAAPPGLALEFRQVEEALEVANSKPGSPTSCNLPSGWSFRREGKSLAFVPPKSQEGAVEGVCGAILTPLCLPVPGRVADPGSGRLFEAAKILLVAGAVYNPENLYAPHLLPSELLVRTWQFGDRFWPAHTKAPKKLKELFQQKYIPSELRSGWPVMVAGEREKADNGGEVVWVQGFAAPAHLRPGAGDREAIWLREVERGVEKG